MVITLWVLPVTQGMDSTGFWQALRKSLLCRFPSVVMSVHITFDLLQLLFQILVSSSGLFLSKILTFTKIGFFHNVHKRELW